MEERRNQLRGWTKDRLLVFDRDSDTAVGYVSNMSVSGLMVVCEKRAQVSSVINCRVALPNQCCGKDQLLFRGEVRWCEEADEPGMVKIGLKFAHIDDIGIKIVVKLLENCTITPASTQDVVRLSS